MSSLGHYILKSLWGHRSRTFLTVSGSAAALFVFCFVGAVQQGMDDLQRGKGADRSLVVFQANKFCPATSHLPQDYGERIARLEGVADVIPIQVYTNNCRASLDVIVFYGVPPEQLRTARDFELESGTWESFEQRQDAALVGRAAAGRRDLALGDSFTLGEMTVEVAGIFRSNDPSEENYIYTHLDFLQRGRGIDRVGTVTQFEVRLQTGADPVAACTRVDDLLEGGPVATDTRPKSVFQARSLGDLRQVLGLARYLGLACVGLVMALVGTTTLMSVEDRVQEHAVLQVLGFSGRHLFAIVTLESALLSLAGGALGIGAATLTLELTHLSVGAEAVTVAFAPSMRLVGGGLIIAMVAGVLAGVVPAMTAARTRIVPALRQA